MAKERGAGARGGGITILRRVLRPIVRRRLEVEKARVVPASYAHKMASGLSDEEMREIHVVEPLLLVAALTDVVQQQTRPRSYRKKDLAGELFPDAMLNDWIAAATPEYDDEEGEDEEGEARIKICNAAWSDLQAYRENQIRHMRDANFAFEIWERRRDQFKAAGMAENPEMTCEMAFAIIKGSTK